MNFSVQNGSLMLCRAGAGWGKTAGEVPSAGLKAEQKLLTASRS